MPIQVNLEFEDKEVADLLCSAIEGGIRYWCKTAHGDFPEAREGLCVQPATPWGEDYTPSYISAPFTEGGALVLKHDGKNDSAKQTTRITRKDLQRGLALMATQAPLHFANFIGDNADAETGDVFVQFCVFGEIVFA